MKEFKQKMQAIDVLIKASEKRLLKTAIDSGIITEEEIQMMARGEKPERVVDFNEFNTIVDVDGRLFNVELGGHDWDRIAEETNRVTNDHRLPLDGDHQEQEGEKKQAD